MSPFGRKKKGDDETVQETVEVPAAPEADEPDPAAWALPADAGAVTTDAGTAPTDAAAAVAPSTVDEQPEPEPQPEPQPAPEPAAPAWTPPADTPSSADPLATATDKYAEVSEQKPELVVAGAFAGAFLFARILKRVTGG